MHKHINTLRVIDLTNTRISWKTCKLKTSVRDFCLCEVAKRIACITTVHKCTVFLRNNIIKPRSDIHLSLQMVVITNDVKICIINHFNLQFFNGMFFEVSFTNYWENAWHLAWRWYVAPILTTWPLLKRFIIVLIMLSFLEIFMNNMSFYFQQMSFLNYIVVKGSGNNCWLGLGNSFEFWRIFSSERFIFNNLFIIWNNMVKSKKNRKRKIAIVIAEIRLKQRQSRKRVIWCWKNTDLTDTCCNQQSSQFLFLFIFFTLFC